MAEETWEDRYKRAVADHVGVPADVPASEITLHVSATDGYRYSSYTFEDPNIRIMVYVNGDYFKTIDGPEAVGDLIRSFLSPKEG